MGEGFSKAIHLFMKKTQFIIWFSFLFLGLGLLRAAPDFITIQGRLTDKNGAPISGTPMVRFELFDSVSGGTSLWSDEKSVPSNSAGLFSTELGPFTNPSFFSTHNHYYLEISVRGVSNWQTLSPRKQLSTVPFSFNAHHAKTSDQAALATDIVDDSISNQKIKDGAVTQTKIAPNSIGTAEIQDGSISSLKLSPNAVESSKIIDESIQSVDLSSYAVRSTNIEDKSIQSIDLATDSITTQHIQDGAIEKSKLALGAVDSDIIANRSVDNIDLKPGLVDPTSIAPGYGLVPSGAIMMFAQACPSGWSRFDLMDGRFPRGSGTYSGIGGGTGAIQGLGLSSTGGHSHTVNSHSHAVGDIKPLMGIRNLNYDNYFVMQYDNSVGAYSSATSGQWHSLAGATMINPASVGTNPGNVAVYGPRMAGKTAADSPDTNTEPAHTHSLSSDGNWRPPYLDIHFCKKD